MVGSSDVGGGKHCLAMIQTGRYFTCLGDVRELPATVKNRHVCFSFQEPYMRTHRRYLQVAPGPDLLFSSLLFSLALSLPRLPAKMCWFALASSSHAATQQHTCVRRDKHEKYLASASATVGPAGPGSVEHDASASLAGLFSIEG